MSLIPFLPRFADRVLRKAALAYGRRMNVQKALAGSRKKALQMGVLAARQSEAYRRLLVEHGIPSSRRNSVCDLSDLPVLDKACTFERFSLDELSTSTAVRDLADVLTSSGRSAQGGRSFGFRLTTREQHRSAWFDIDLGLQDIFGVDERTTLLVNCLPMGVTFQSRAVTVANVSVREDMACAILRDVGPRFDQTLLCADPLFIRKILDEARAAGVDWTALNTSLILGEEVLVEAQRDYLASRMGMTIQKDGHRLIGSSFGVGELGLNLLFETRETIHLRRAMRGRLDVQSMVCGSSNLRTMPSLFCYNPLRCHIEVINPGSDGFGELCVTMLDPNAVIHLPRYATGDAARLVNQEELATASQSLGMVAPWLPTIAIKGRIKDQNSQGITVEEIKETIYSDHDIADSLTGAFRISKDANNMPVLTLQVNVANSIPEGMHASVLDLFKWFDHGVLSIELLSVSEFPWRPSLDHERKFPYVA